MSQKFRTFAAHFEYNTRNENEDSIDSSRNHCFDCGCGCGRVGTSGVWRVSTCLKRENTKLAQLLQRHVPKPRADAAVYRKRSPQYTHKGEEKGRRIVSDDLAVLDGSG